MICWKFSFRKFISVFRLVLHLNRGEIKVFIEGSSRQIENRNLNIDAHWKLKLYVIIWFLGLLQIGQGIII